MFLGANRKLQDSRVWAPAGKLVLPAYQKLLAYQNKKKAYGSNFFYENTAIEG